MTKNHFFMSDENKSSSQNEIVPSFTRLQNDMVTLHLITSNNLNLILEQISNYHEASYFRSEITAHYTPRYDTKGRRNRWGFYTTQNDELVGFSLLGINSWDDKRGYTGADTLPHQRGKRIAPASKPHLFYLGFYLLGLNRIETGCFVRNDASRRSIEKTPGFVFEGTLRQYAWDRVTKRFEDELRYAILRDTWQALYDPNDITLVP